MGEEDDSGDDEDDSKRNSNDNTNNNNNNNNNNNSNTTNEIEKGMDKLHIIDEDPSIEEEPDLSSRVRTGIIYRYRYIFYIPLYICSNYST